jgi:uncharacterized phage-associated protein
MKMQAAIRNISLSKFDFEQQVTHLKLKKQIFSTQQILACSTSPTLIAEHYRSV